MNAENAHPNPERDPGVVLQPVVSWRHGKKDKLQHATPTNSKYVKAICGAWHPYSGWINSCDDTIHPKCHECLRQAC